MNIEQQQETLLALLIMDGQGSVGAGIQQGLTPQDFTDEHCRGVWQAILDLFNEGKIIDGSSIINNAVIPYDRRHPQAKMGMRILEASDVGAISNSIVSLIPPVKEEAKRVACVAIGQRIAIEASQTAYKASEAVGAYIDALTNLNGVSKPTKRITELFDESIAKSGKGIDPDCIPLPLLSMNAACGVFLKNHVVGLFASPGCGKTAMSLQWAQKIAIEENRRVDLILRESGGDLSTNTDRMIMSMVGRDYKRGNPLTESEEARIRQNAKILERNLHITEGPSNKAELIAYAKYASDNGSRLIIYDCLNQGDWGGDGLYENFRNGSKAMVHARDAMNGRTVMAFCHHLDEEGKVRFAQNDLKADLDYGILLKKSTAGEEYITMEAWKARNDPKFPTFDAEFRRNSQIFIDEPIPRHNA